MKQKKHQEESGFQRFRKNMKELTFEQKIDHIWTYYRGTVLLMILIPCFLGIILHSALKEKPEFVFSGNFSNTVLSPEGQSYLINDWLALLDKEPGTALIEIDHSQTLGNNMSFANGVGMDEGVQVAVSVASNDLDYIVCDQVAMDFYAVQGAFLPLDRIFEEQELSLWEDRIYYYTDPETGTEFPAAMDLTEEPFFQDCVSGDGELYLCFANDENADFTVLRQFFTHIMAWENK